MDGCSLREQVNSNLIRGDPDVVSSEQIDLVDGTMLIGPLLEAKIRVGPGYIPDPTNHW